MALAKKGSETSEEVDLYTEAADTSEGDRCPEYIIITRCGCGGMDLRVFLAIPRVLFLVGTVLIRTFSPSSAKILRRSRLASTLYCHFSPATAHAQRDC